MPFGLVLFAIRITLLATMNSRDRFAEFSERYGPYVWAAVATAALWRWNDRLVELLSGAALSRHEIAAAAFNIQITITGLLFSVFVLAIAPGGGFIERIFKTKTFEIFRGYVIQALLLGSASAALCVPFMVTKDDSPSVGVWSMEWLKLVAVFMVISALLAQFRVARIFMVWVSADAKLRRQQR